MRTTLPALLLLTACATPTSTPVTPPAFPGAEGEGAISLGGRGGRAITVTTLADDGPGSLRAAVEASGPRTVVFAVSGTIALKKPLRITEGRITIAGQTAPGDGITLRDHPLMVDADDVVVRFIRSRLGDEFFSMRRTFQEGEVRFAVQFGVTHDQSKCPCKNHRPVRSSRKSQNRRPAATSTR